MSGVSGRGHGVRLTVPVVQCGRRRNERERKKMPNAVRTDRNPTKIVIVMLDWKSSP